MLVVVDRRQHDWVMFACEQQPSPTDVVVVLDDSAQSMTLDELQIGGEAPHAFIIEKFRCCGVIRSCVAASRQCGEYVSEPVYDFGYIEADSLHGGRENLFQLMNLVFFLFNLDLH